MRITASQEQISCDLGEEAVILNLKSGEYYGLDPVGAKIWGWLETPQAVVQLRDRLVEDVDDQGRFRPNRARASFVAAVRLSVDRSLAG